MLAFAQQKAKDTGQSVDYMVDSIVTGLGRKSLMILDNLGLSAAEIRDKMKETGDMTKAVGEIIREQMSKAGEYVETATDKMTRQQAELNNAMLELGTTMREVTGFSGWDEMATAIKTQVVGALQFTIETIGEAKNAWNSFMQTIGVKDKPKKQSQSTQVFPDGTYWEDTDAQGNVIASGRWLNGKRIQTGLGDVVINGRTGGGGGGTTHTPKIKTFDTSKVAFNVGEVGPNTYRDVPSVHAMLGDQGLRAMMGIGAQQFDPNKDISTRWRVNKKGQLTDKKDEDKKDTQVDILKGVETMTGSLQGIFDGINKLGIELPEELTSMLGVLQTIASIVSAIQSMETVGKFLGIIPGFANGGMVPRAANGRLIEGNNYSGDNIYAGNAWVNSGELVLSRAQQGNLASQLQGGGMQNMQLSAVITGEQLRLVMNNNGRRTGRGEVVTTNFR